MSKFDEIRKIYSPMDVAPQPALRGPVVGCPQCRGTSGHTYVGQVEFQFCVAHRCYWSWGMDFGTAVSPALLERQKREWTDLGLEDFQQVEPWLRDMVAAA